MAASSELAIPQEREPLPSRYVIGVAGQGGTSIGEAYRQMYDSSPGFRRIFDEAEAVVEDELNGLSLQGLCFETEPERQKVAQGLVEQTRLSHLVNTTVYGAKYASFVEDYAGSPYADFILPQSAGECAALYISGMTDFRTSLLIAQKRGELTEAAGIQNPGRMVYVAGLHGGYERLHEVCEDVNRDARERGLNGIVSVANRNAPDIQIFSGTDELVTAVTEKLDKKVINLPISFGSHCALMEPVVDDFRDYMRSFKFTPPYMGWILNGDVIYDPDEIVERMAQGPTQMVDYQASVEEMARFGVGAMVELSPNTKNRAVVGRYAADTMKHLGADFQLILR